jgi:Protein kinase domain
LTERLVFQKARSGEVPFARDRRFKKLGQAPVGKGSKAEVWKARDVDANPFVPDRLVAVKLPNEHAEADDHSRLRREGGEDRRFDHENVVRIFDLRGGPRSPFLVMEYIAGEDLKKLLGRRKRLAPERVVEVAIQLCSGLQCLHDAGLVHRDVKPGNLMIVGNVEGPEPIQLKLTDLGIAVAPGDSDVETAGTEPYIAPEVKAHEEATEAADVYGAGAVLYELATGQQLSSLSTSEWVAGRRDEPVTPPHELEPAVPEWLSSVIMRAIEVEPLSRYLTAEEMRDDLENAAFACAEAPTTVFAAEEEAQTEVLGRKKAKPLAFRLLDALPGWLRDRLPANLEEEESPDVYPFLLALAAGLIVALVAFLPIVVRVVVVLCALPFWLLMAIVFVSAGLVWLLREEDRREATGRVLRTCGAGLWRGLCATGNASQRALGAGARHLGALAVAGWRWASSLSWPEPPAPLAEDGEARCAEPGRARPRPASDHRSFGHHGQRGRAWAAAHRSSVEAFLRGSRVQLAEAGAVARAWVPWLGRRVYLIVLMACVVCLALWLDPALQSRVAQRPGDHRLVLNVVPAAVWLLCALVGLRVLSVWRATPRRLITGGLVFLVLLAAIGLAMPSFSSWLEPRFWPDDQVESAQAETPGTSTAPTVVAQRTPREAARADSRHLATRVRKVEESWMQLFRSLQQDSWTISGDTKGAVREGADVLVSRLSGWRTLSQYELTRKAARHWSKSMEGAVSKLRTNVCSKFTVGPRGAKVWC